MKDHKKIFAALAAAAMLFSVGCGQEEPDTALVPNDNGEGVATAAAETKVTLPKVRPDSGISIAPDQNESSTTAVGESVSSPMENISGGNGETADPEAPHEDNGNVDGNNGNDENTADTPTATTPVQPATSAGAPAVTATKPASAAPETEIYYLEGTVWENNGKTLLINETDFRKVSVGFASGVKLDGIKPGDKVLITYDGMLAESYPYQASAAYSVEVTEKAAKSCKVEHYTKNDLAFSILVPEDWSGREMDYPTEGDFTDWGIRFSPEGQTGGLDIAWHSAFSFREAFSIKPATVNGNKVQIYSKNGAWKYYVYENNFIAAASFYGTQDYSQYIPEMELMLDNLEFE